MSAPVRVEASGVTLAFGDNTVLRGIELAVEPGEFFALLGPSGCGKSTLLRLIAGFNRAQQGRVRIGGIDITDTPPWKRGVGMVFQSYALWPHMTVEQNVAFGLEERRLPRGEIREKVRQALELVGLADLGARRPGQLSGGQQQRVALARTLAVEPAVLLLDEPLSNLDAKLRHHMRRELVALQQRLGITTIFVTHDQEEALTTADRIAVMDHGVIRQVGTPMDLHDRPANRFVAEFIGTINVIEGELQKGIGGGLRLVSPDAGVLDLPWREDLPGHGTVALGVRPHAITVTQRDNDASRVWLPGRVKEREFLGEFVRYRALSGGAEFIADAAHRAGNHPFDVGDEVRLGLDPAEMRLLQS